MVIRAVTFPPSLGYPRGAPNKNTSGRTAVDREFAHFSYISAGVFPPPSPHPPPTSFDSVAGIGDCAEGMEDSVAGIGHGGEGIQESVARMGDCGQGMQESVAGV